MQDTLLDIYIDSNIGGRVENQDYALKLETKLGQLVLVCDGMGGAKGGALASELASIVIRKEFENLSGTENPVEAIQKAIQKANKLIFEKSRSDMAVRGMGTTVALLLISPDHRQAYTAHVGDSRVYQIRKGKRLFKTRDHSVVQEMVQRGELKEKEARTHPQSNQITRALGIKEIAEIEYGHFTCKPYDVFLVTSDGIHGEIEDTEIAKIAAKGPSSVNISQALIQTAFTNGEKSKNGGHDNLTVATIVVFYSSKRKALFTDSKLIALAATCMLFAVILYIFWPNNTKSSSSVTPPIETPKSTSIEQPKIIKEIELHCEEVKKSNKKDKAVMDYKIKLPKSFEKYGILNIENCFFRPTGKMEVEEEQALEEDLEKLKQYWNTIK